jgi:hypothetical protein
MLPLQLARRAQIKVQTVQFFVTKLPLVTQSLVIKICTAGAKLGLEKQAQEITTTHPEQLQLKCTHLTQCKDSQHWLKFLPQEMLKNDLLFESISFIINTRKIILKVHKTKST